MAEYDELPELQNLNLPSPDSFSEKIKESSDKLDGILEDYKNAYVNFNSDPNNTEYDTSFGVAKSNITSLISAMSSTNQDILDAIRTYNINLSDMNRDIGKARAINVGLKQKLGIATGEQAGSGQLIGDYKQLYNNAYNRNWGLFVGVLLALVVTTIVFYVPEKYRKVDMTYEDLQDLKNEKNKIERDKVQLELEKTKNLIKKQKKQFNRPSVEQTNLLQQQEQAFRLAQRKKQLNKDLQSFDRNRLNKLYKM
jgi:hypothetical protein